jgi:hypothetical protein|tara:strand:- start:75 stop:320 length:246 start_codon:yes stop_codon:yes gene_type:complete
MGEGGGDLRELEFLSVPAVLLSAPISSNKSLLMEEMSSAEVIHRRWFFGLNLANRERGKRWLIMFSIWFRSTRVKNCVNTD